MARINPPIARESSQYNPIHRVTGLFDSSDGVTRAVHDLEDAGFVGDAIELFAGPAGEEALDTTGDENGPVARAFRALEQWMSDTSEVHQEAAQTLHAGGFAIAVVVGTDEALKETAMSILTRHGGREVKYWSQFYVESK